MTQTPGGLVVDLSRDPAGVTATVTGDLDLATARHLTDAVLEPLEDARDGSAHPRLTLDLAGVAFCDSVGISALVEIRQACADRGWGLGLVRLQPSVRRVLDFTGLGEYLDVR